MDLPDFLEDEKTTHLLILLATVANSLLIVLLFFGFIGVLTPIKTKEILPTIRPVSAQTPTVRFSLISPQANTIVSGIVPLVTTLTNGPQIKSAELYVNSQVAQSVTSKETQQLTLFWDTTKSPDGPTDLIIKVTDDRNTVSYFNTALLVKNNIAR